MAFEDGPYVQAACFCDMALRDNTGVLSLIRIIDTLTHTARGASPPETMPPIPYKLTLVLMLKSGNARGRYDLKVTPELPSGETESPFVISVHFEGEEKGHEIIADLPFIFRQEGLYWFNIYLDDEKLTAIPFRVKYSRMIAGQSPS
jgi:hypothetical protein